jgi:hypothetical protein
MIASAIVANVRRWPAERSGNASGELPGRGRHMARVHVTAGASSKIFVTSGKRRIQYKTHENCEGSTDRILMAMGPSAMEQKERRDAQGGWQPQQRTREGFTAVSRK